MEVGRLLCKQECNEASDVELQFLRLLTPITKLNTAKQVNLAMKQPYVQEYAMSYNVNSALSLIELTPNDLLLRCSSRSVILARLEKLQEWVSVQNKLARLGKFAIPSQTSTLRHASLSDSFLRLP